MASSPGIRLPVRADASHVIAVIDVIARHLAAMRAELAALSAPETVHAAGAAVTPCCGASVFGLPRGDRITADPALVTCGGA